MNLLSKLAVAAVFTSASALAQDAGHGAHAGHGSAVRASEAAGADQAHVLTDGEIRKIDKENGKLTIRHGELKNLGMAPMTMAFRTRDPAMLEQVQVGDKVRFAAERADGVFRIVVLENVK